MSKSSITVTGPEQIPAAVQLVVGYTPVERLVVIPSSGAPVAAVEYRDDNAVIDLTGVKQMLATAQPHWRGKQLIVACYCDDAEVYADIYPQLAGLFPGSTVAVAPRVHEGQVWPTPYSEPVAAVGTHSGRTRDDLRREAEQVTSFQEAVRLACLSWSGGNGALTNLYKERAHALSDGSSTHVLVVATLHSLMENAVEPTDDTIGDIESMYLLAFDEELN